MSRSWTAQQVRVRLEEYLLSDGPRSEVELLGTVIPDENHLTVLVRSLSKTVFGDLQSISFDLDYLYREAPAMTIDDAFTEVVHGSLHFFDIHCVGVDQWGVRHWTESRREGWS